MKMFVLYFNLLKIKIKQPQTQNDTQKLTTTKHDLYKNVIGQMI